MEPVPTSATWLKTTAGVSDVRASEGWGYRVVYGSQVLGRPQFLRHIFDVCSVAAKLSRSSPLLSRSSLHPQSLPLPHSQSQICCRRRGVARAARLRLWHSRPALTNSIPQTPARACKYSTWLPGRGPRWIGAGSWKHVLSTWSDLAHRNPLQSSRQYAEDVWPVAFHWRQALQWSSPMTSIVDFRSPSIHSHRKSWKDRPRKLSAEKHLHATHHTRSITQ